MAELGRVSPASPLARSLGLCLPFTSVLPAHIFLAKLTIWFEFFFGARGSFPLSSPCLFVFCARAGLQLTAMLRLTTLPLLSHRADNLTMLPSLPLPTLSCRPLQTCCSPYSFALSFSLPQHPSGRAPSAAGHRARKPQCYLSSSTVPASPWRFPHT